ncbi:MAG: sigma 54-interacting transcriptional regulator [Thermodesulfobacteriota bacterium]|nr:sigma 54-interacting transcriptional regulator [Thermodesulfobacteriota bacterium]
MGPRIKKTYISITDDIIASWQGIVDTVAELVHVPSALIMKAAPPFIEVFRTSASHNNPYELGDRERLPGLYCDWVIRHRSKLLVANALKDEEWATNPDTRLGMIAYLGFPLLWPDGEVFGTICVLDAKENSFGPSYERLLLKFKELVEAHLALLYKATFDRKNLEGILDNLAEGIIAHDTERRILFFNRAAEEITGYSRDDVLEKDCHEAFGGPFCGGRCAFDGVTPQSLGHLAYPLTIVTRKGEPRRIEMSVTGMMDETGSFAGILAAFRDVTDLIGSQIKLGELTSFAGIVGHDYRMQRIFQQIGELATNDYPVHISGETGTGKELVAAAIHNESRRGGGPFVPVNCAALPEGTLESELFGHVKGAFTGALRDKKGRFELAHNGTLFLDEVADLPPFVQVKLLRVLQEGAFERVGAEETTSVNVRIISATNRDLKREVKEGRFREDLYYRINVVPIHIPPLRKRRKDIPLLLEHFLSRGLDEGQDSPGFSKEALATMMAYSWPGNVRELQSAIRFALVKSKGRIVQPDRLPMELRKEPSRKLDPEGVRAALVQSGGNKAKAARILGVGRATLYRFLADFPDVS